MTCMGPCRGLPRARVQPQMSREVATFAFACVLMRVWSHATDQLTGNAIVGASHHEPSRACKGSCVVTARMMG